MKLKFTRCMQCDARLDIGDDAVEFQQDIFCDMDCLKDYIEWEADFTEISLGDCTDEEEDDRDDADE